MEDDFQVNEIEMINKYIKPQDQRSIIEGVSSIACLFVVEGAVTGFMTHLCKHTTYLCTNRQQCM